MGFVKNAVDIEEKLLLHPDEMSYLTKLTANVLYDVYYTRTMVKFLLDMNKKDDTNKIGSITEQQLEKMYEETVKSLEMVVSSLSTDKVVDTYEMLMKNNPGICVTEENIISIVDVLLNKDASVLENIDEFGEVIIRFNDFEECKTEEEKIALRSDLDELRKVFNDVQQSQNISEFNELCTEYFPLISKYVITELELCDLIKPLGRVTKSGDISQSTLYYINIEYPPKPPVGYSNVFSYPLMPYKISGFLTNDGRITNIFDRKKCKYLVTAVIDDFELGVSIDAEKINVIIEITLFGNMDDSIYKKGRLIKKYCLQFDFMSYLSMYSNNSVPNFLTELISFADTITDSEQKVYEDLKKSAYEQRDSVPETKLLTRLIERTSNVLLEEELEIAKNTVTEDYLKLLGSTMTTLTTLLEDKDNIDEIENHINKLSQSLKEGMPDNE